MKNRSEDLIFKDESYAIMGACFAVYSDKGCGFLEAVYQECLEIEFEHSKIPAAVQPSIRLSYRGRTLRHVYQPDFICYDLTSLSDLQPPFACLARFETSARETR